MAPKRTRRGRPTTKTDRAADRAKANVADKASGTSDRLTYRELRNTPGRVWERLAAGGPLTLMADGEAKAIVIPVEDGDVRGAIEAYSRGRAMMAIHRIQASSRAKGTDKMTLAEINEMIRDVRNEMRREEAARSTGR